MKNALKKNVLILILLIIYLIFSIFLIHPRFSDEIIYINMAKWVSKGLLPYKDFFFAHPPFQLFFLAPIASFSNFALAKLFVFIISAFTAYLFYLFALKVFRNHDLAFYSFLLFILSPSFLIYSREALGVFESLFLFFLGLNMLRKNEKASLTLITFSVFTRYLTIFLLPFVFLIIKRKKERKKFLIKLSFFLVFFFFLLVILFGFEYVNNTFLFHLQVNVKNRFFIPEVYMHLGLSEISISFLSFFYFLRKRHKFAIFSFYIR